MTARLHRKKSKTSQPFHREARLRLENLEDRTMLDAAVGPELLIALRNGQYQTVPVATGDVSSALASWQARADVLSAEVNQTVSISVIPNDPSFGSLWGLNNTGQSGGVADADIDAPEAWNSYTGGTNKTVGIIDTGIDYRHPDLYLNVWINQGEIPTAIRNALTDVDGDTLITFYDLNNPINIGAGKITDLNANGYIDAGDILNNSSGWENGVDNDPVAGNADASKIDDLIGWDFVNNDNDPFDDNNHGTHVAGTIGAIGNNGVGVTGVNWKTQMAGLKFLNASGSGSTANAVSALNYAVGQSIPISNNSWGGGGFSSALNTAISNARNAGHIFVAAAGNSSSNNDVTPHYPSSYSQDNIIAVASTTRTETLSSFSSYGATTVDVGASAGSILSTTPNNTYSTFNGTSMATPHVAGAVALVWSQSPSLTYSQVISRILGNVDVTAALTGKVATNGRLNVQRALGVAPDVTGPRVTDASNGSAPVSSVRLTFSEAISVSTFTPDDVTLTGPGGGITVIGVTAVNGSNNTQFDVTFAAQSAAGTYNYTVGPDVRDAAGNLMNQNQNGSNGETPGDQFTGSFTIQPSGTTDFTSADTPLPITDFNTTTSTIVVSQNLTIADLNVRLNLNHTYDGDLQIRLRGPNGVTIFLSNRRGGSGNNFTNTVFNDEAATNLSSGSAPFTGSYRPDGGQATNRLSRYDNISTVGTWTLTVYDAAGIDTGSLLNWTLSVTTGGGGAGLSVGAPESAFEAPTAFAAKAGLDSTAALRALAASLVEERATPAAVERAASRSVEPTRLASEVTGPAPAREEETPAARAGEERATAEFGEDEAPIVWTA